MLKLYNNINLAISVAKYAPLTSLVYNSDGTDIYEGNKFLFFKTAIKKLVQIFFYSSKVKTTKVETFEIGVLIRHPSQFQMWKKTLDEFKPEQITILINDDKFRKEILQIVSENNWNSIDFNDSLKLFRLKSFFYYLRNVRKVTNPISLFETLGRTEYFIQKFNTIEGKVLLTLAYEVNPISHVFCQIAQSNNIRVVNTMNGLKNHGVRNSDTNFDTWLVWSEHQKDLLVNYNKIPANQLVISGHLNADYLPQIDPKTVSQKYDLLFFTQPDPHGIRPHFMKEVNEIIKAYPDLKMGIKIHPLEKKEDIEGALDTNNKIEILDDHGKEELFDSILSSNLIVIMYSTIGIEALMMGKRVVSFRHGEDRFPINEEIVPRFTNLDEFNLCRTIDEFDGKDMNYFVGPKDGFNYKNSAKLIATYL